MSEASAVITAVLDQAARAGPSPSSPVPIIGGFTGQIPWSTAVCDRRRTLSVSTPASCASVIAKKALVVTKTTGVVRLVVSFRRGVSPSAKTVAPLENRLPSSTGGTTVIEDPLTLIGKEDQTDVFLPPETTLISCPLRGLRALRRQGANQKSGAHYPPEGLFTTVGIASISVVF